MMQSPRLALNSAKALYLQLDRWQQIFITTSMNENQPVRFSVIVALQFKRLKEWVTPDPGDRIVVSVIKTLLKSLALLVMLAFSPVMLVALFLGFIGLM